MTKVTEKGATQEIYPFVFFLWLHRPRNIEVIHTFILPEIRQGKKMITFGVPRLDLFYSVCLVHPDHPDTLMLYDGTFLDKFREIADAYEAFSGREIEIVIDG